MENITLQTTELQGRTFYDLPLSVHDLESPGLIEESVDWTLPFGSLKMNHWYFDGIRMGFRQHRYHDYFTFEKKNDLDVVNLQFNLKGNYTIFHMGNTYEVTSQQHNIVYSKGVSNTFRNNELEAEVFEIQFTPDTFLRIIEDSNDSLKKFADKVVKGEPVVLSPGSLFINLELQKVIQEVRNCRYTGGLKKMFMLSKSIEILVLQAEAHDKAIQNNGGTVCRKNDDKDRILFARDYVIEHMDNPPALSQLAKIAGLNEYKLKRGFKEIFNSTVFGYLADHRLIQAKQALIDNDKTASEIAYELGYSSPQHFNHAFKKKFGVTPKELKNTP